MRAGREPAEDVKKRIVAACQEVGLKIQSARMYLRYDQGDRVIYVSAVTPGGPFRRSNLDISAIVVIDGHWSGRLEIRCAAAQDDLDPSFWDIPILRGRNAVPLRD